MTGPDGKIPARRSGRSVILPLAGVAVVASVLGGGVTFGVLQWQAQQAKLAELAAVVSDLQARTADDLATRAAPLETAALVAPDDQPAPAVAEAADQLRAIISEAFPAEPATAAAPALDPSRIEDATRLETLALIEAGVNELVAAVVAGNYEIHTNYTDEHFSGRIHFAFAGDAGDQTDLEQFLAAAAEAGIIAHSSSVVDSEGRVNGHILLFDLVERALENGSPEERAASERMRAEAVALLDAEVTVGEPANTASERFYVVEEGDSLAYISLQFYGNTNDYNRIFQANRNLLVTPDRISPGQRLVIPG